MAMTQIVTQTVTVTQSNYLPEPIQYDPTVIDIVLVKWERMQKDTTMIIERCQFQCQLNYMFYYIFQIKSSG